MDYQEAIEYFEKELRYKKMVLSPLLEGKETVNEQYIKIAISAMKEMQEYKQKLNNAYGECDDLLRTVVDGLVRHEGIEFGTPIKSRILTDDDVDLWEWYKQLGTLDEVREAVEKQKAKKPEKGNPYNWIDSVIVKGRYRDVRKTSYGYACPNCGKRVIKDMNFCPKCGQEIDWSDE